MRLLKSILFILLILRIVKIQLLLVVRKAFSYVVCCFFVARKAFRYVNWCNNTFRFSVRFAPGQKIVFSVRFAPGQKVVFLIFDGKVDIDNVDIGLRRGM